MVFIGRKKPYTDIGIARKKCQRCGKPAVHQWQVCANDNRYVPICLKCDIALNELALKFMRIPNVKRLMDRYKFMCPML